VGHPSVRYLTLMTFAGSLTYKLSEPRHAPCTCVPAPANSSVVLPLADGRNASGSSFPRMVKSPVSRFTSMIGFMLHKSYPGPVRAVTMSGAAIRGPRNTPGRAGPNLTKSTSGPQRPLAARAARSGVYRRPVVSRGRAAHSGASGGILPGPSGAVRAARVPSKSRNAERAGSHPGPLASVPGPGRLLRNGQSSRQNRGPVTFTH